MKRIIVQYVKKILMAVPSKKIRRKLRNKVYYSEKLSNIFMYEEKHHHGYTYNDTNTKQIHFYDKKIAININVNKESFFDNIQLLLNNIYYEFDIYISCTNDCNIKKLIKNIKKNIYLNEVFVTRRKEEVLKNSFTLINNDFERYSYVLNINTCDSCFDNKKFDALIKEKYIFKNLIYLFSDNKIKAINFQTLIKPQKRIICTEILKVIDTLNINEIEYNNFLYAELSEYIIGPLSFVDNRIFEKINYQYTINDKTNYEEINYSFQKLIKLIKDKFEYKILEFDFNKKKFKQLLTNETICEINKEHLLKELNNYNIVSFDIFDTLIARKISAPDDIFNLLDIKLKKEYKYDGNFLEIRKKAELLAMKKLERQVNINDIYEQVANLLKLNNEEVEKIKQEEINLEMNMIVPRKDMVDIYNQLIKNKKKILVISDMYLPSEIIKNMLNQVGIKKYDDLFVSCDCNCRKDNGKMWKMIKEKYTNQKIIHIGDNDNSDIKQALLNDIYAFKIHSGKEISEKKLTINTKGLDNSLIFGNIINSYLFNSPFSLYDERLDINNSYEYGEAILSPILIYYFSWLLKQLKEDKRGHLLFVSRDGYYLKKFYENIINKCNFDYLKEIKYDYFLTSRRAASIASVETEEDLFEILNTQYEGTLKNLFYYRFGVTIDVADKNIKLPDDIDEVKGILVDNIQKFLQTAKTERKNYLEYIKTIDKKNIDNHFIFIDLGYSGTAQYYISKLINKKTKGYYFLTSSNIKPYKLNCEVKSCFNVNGNLDSLYKNSLLLESFLTAPCGQLNKFTKIGNKLVPEYLDYKNNEKVQVSLDMMFESINSIFNFLIEKEIDIESIEIDKNNIYKLYNYFLNRIRTLPKEITDTFYVEDFYCLNRSIKVIDC